MKIIDEKLLNWVSALAKESARLGRNYDFYRSLDEKCHGWLCLPLSRLGNAQASLALLSLLHRFLNAVEAGTVVEIHRHPGKDETFVLLRGRVVVKTYNDDGNVIDSGELCPEDGRYGVNIPKGGGISWR